jgi:hypothetical protein
MDSRLALLSGLFRLSDFSLFSTSKIIVSLIYAMKLPFIFSFSTLFLLVQIFLFGQIDPVNRENYRIHILRTNIKIVIDGLLEEKVWLQSEHAENFHRVLPIDTGYALAQTEVMLTYDESNLYIAIICHDTFPGKRPIESLRRDWFFPKNDNFIAFIDTYNDQTNGFAFGISAAGAQWDGLQANGGFVSLDWDTKWKTAVKNYADRWVAEFSIPFRSIRYRYGETEWGINFSRLDLKTNEKSSWAPVPRQFQTANLAFTGTLVWDRPLPESGTRFSLIPYISSKATQDVAAGENINIDATAGLDAKVILSTSLNLDLTLNPDFSQVEVDRQRTNLDRFELFFPEKRQFFLENSDLFASLGTVNIRPFFSRRIGLSNPVQAGARLSGQLGKNWRIGLMDIQTGTKNDIRAANFGVAVIQRQIFSRSNITAFMINKQITSPMAGEDISDSDYNRVAGIDLNISSADSRWTGKAFYHQSFYPGASIDASTLAGQFTYETQQFSASLNQAWVGPDYLAEVGYIQRKGFYQINPTIKYKFFPKSRRITNHGPILELDLFYKPDLSLTDREIQLGYAVEWLDRSKFTMELEDGFVKLQAPFDPTNTGGDSLAAGSEFRWKEIAASYISDIRKLFNYKLSTRYGGFYNGTRLSLNGELNYRVQPYGSLAVMATYHQIILPEPYNSAELVLIGPRLDITFTDKLFLTTFAQYNNQIDNFNVNIRFQWRFAPVSDFYIVYTENAYPDDFRTKNRGLVAKLSYWFN